MITYISLRLYTLLVTLILVFALTNVEGRKYEIFKRLKCGASKDALLKSLLKISEGACVDECSRRPSCKALDYSGRFKLCKLYSREDIELVKGHCIYLKRTDIVIKSACDENCNEGQVCDKSTNTCVVSECQPLTGDNLSFRGNLNDIGSTKREIIHNPFGMSFTMHPSTTCQENGTWSPYNVALGKHVTLSSVYRKDNIWAFGHLMVNGDTSGVWFCACTLRTASPWAKVDLGENYLISSFQIYNRRECCPGRLHDLEIYVGPSMDISQLCFKYQGFLDPIMQSIHLTETCLGRYVKLQIDDGIGWFGDPFGQHYLTICELQIYGTPFYG